MSVLKKTFWGVAFLGSVLMSAPFCAVAQVRQSVELRAQRVVEITNQERAKRGLPPLKLQSELKTAANWMATDMARNNYFAHIDSRGRSMAARIPAYGYKTYRALGENLAAGQTSPKEAVSAWLQSPGHRANLLSPAYREIGVAYVTAPNTSYETYWVQEFGNRRDCYPLVIDLEAAQTDKTEVELYVYGIEWAESMRFSNDGVNWSDWEPYRSEKRWNLEPGEGMRTVLVELRHRYGDVMTSEDTIMLVAPTPSKGRVEISGANR